MVGGAEGITAKERMREREGEKEKGSICIAWFSVMARVKGLVQMVMLFLLNYVDLGKII